MRAAGRASAALRGLSCGELPSSGSGSRCCCCCCSSSWWRSEWRSCSSFVRSSTGERPRAATPRARPREAHELLLRELGEGKGEEEPDEPAR
jgi:hypothetical protein